MHRTSPILTNFTGGECSQLLEGRVDVSKYHNACKTLENMLPLIYGPATRRPGTYFVTDAKYPNKKCRLIPFQFSTTQAYMIELGDQYMRFFMDEGQIADDTELISNGTFDSDFSDWTDKSGAGCKADYNAAGHNAGLTGAGTTAYAWMQQEVTINTQSVAHLLNAGITGTVAVRIGTTDGGNEILDDTYYTSDIVDLEINPGANATIYVQFRHKDDDVYYVDDVSLMRKAYEISVPYLEADLFELQFCQSADTMYIVHEDYRPRKLTRTGHTSWTLTVVDWQDGPYLAEQSDNGITPSDTTGSITLTADSDLWVAGDVYRLVRLKCTGDVWRWCQITGYTSATEVTATVKGDDLPNTNKVTTFRLGYWSSGNGWPISVTLHEQRLVLFGCGEYPQTIWGSVTDSYEDFTPGTEDTDPFVFTIGTNTMDAAKWIISGQYLFLGTAGGEFIARASTADEAMTPTNFTVRRHDTSGSELIAPLIVQNNCIFTQRNGRKLREFRYDLEKDGHQSVNLSLLAEHVTEGGITETDFQQELDSIIWAIRADGTLLALTYERIHDVVAWSRHTTEGYFESVGVIPGDNQDEVWVVVKRTIDGSVDRYIEYFKDREFGDVEDAFFVDSGLTYDGVAVSALSGLDHLEGETVAVLVDGAAHPDCTVSSGAISLDWSGEKIHVGLGYTSVLETMRLELTHPEGTAQAKSKRIYKAAVRFYETVGCEFGPNSSDLDTIYFRTTSDELSEAVPLFTGDKEVEFPLGCEKDARIYCRQTQPLPMTITAIMPRVVMSDL